MEYIKKGKFFFQKEHTGKLQTWWLENRDAIELVYSLVRKDKERVSLFLFSPPYYRAKTYGLRGEFGQEEHYEQYINYLLRLVGFAHSLSTKDANLMIILSDSRNMSGGTGGDFIEDGEYTETKQRGSKIREIPRKAQLLIPERLRIAIADNTPWVPISSIFSHYPMIWDKNSSRRSATHRPSDSYEHILLFGASSSHYWNRDAVLEEFSEKTLPQMESDYQGKSQWDYKKHKEEDPSDMKRRMISSMGKRPGAYLKSIWNIPAGAMPKTEIGGSCVKGRASFPLLLAEICVMLATKPGDLVCDPFMGTGTTGLAALMHGRRFFGNDLDPIMVEFTEKRIGGLR